MYGMWSLRLIFFKPWQHKDGENRLLHLKLSFENVEKRWASIVKRSMLKLTFGASGRWKHLRHSDHQVISNPSGYRSLFCCEARIRKILCRMDFFQRQITPRILLRDLTNVSASRLTVKKLSIVILTSWESDKMPRWDIECPDVIINRSPRIIYMVQMFSPTSSLRWKKPQKIKISRDQRGRCLDKWQTFLFKVWTEYTT